MKKFALTAALVATLGTNAMAQGIQPVETTPSSQGSCEWVSSSYPNLLCNVYDPQFVFPVVITVIATALVVSSTSSDGTR
jgi:hypothetical protein